MDQYDLNINCLPFFSVKYPPRITLKLYGTFPKIDPCLDVIHIQGVYKESMKELDDIQGPPGSWLPDKKGRYRQISPDLEYRAFCDKDCADSPSNITYAMECTVPGQTKSLDVVITHYLMW